MNTVLRNMILASTLPMTIYINENRPSINLLAINHSLLRTEGDRPKDQHKKTGPNSENKNNKKNKKNNNDQNDGSGGLLEPIIEDLQGWIRRRSPSPSTASIL